MLKVYAVKWCPHCTQTIEYLKNNKIAFEYFEIEEQPDEIVEKVIQANGGEDWVVPTMEFNGEWLPGKIYNEKQLASDLNEIGVI